MQAKQWLISCTVNDEGSSGWFLTFGTFTSLFQPRAGGRDAHVCHRSYDWAIERQKKTWREHNIW